MSPCHMKILKAQVSWHAKAEKIGSKILRKEGKYCEGLLEVSVIFLG